MTVELTTDQICTVLDALEQWEEGLDSEMQGDELDEARKYIHTLRGVLRVALVRENAEHLIVKLFGEQHELR